MHLCCTHLNSLDWSCPVCLMWKYTLFASWKMCVGRATLPGVVSLYSAAYLCSTESAFDNTYLYRFTTTSADIWMKCSRMMAWSAGVLRVVKSEMVVSTSWERQIVNSIHTSQIYVLGEETDRGSSPLVPVYIPVSNAQEPCSKWKLNLLASRTPHWVRFPARPRTWVVGKLTLKVMISGQTSGKRNAKIRPIRVLP